MSAERLLSPKPKKDAWEMYEEIGEIKGDFRVPLTDPIPWRVIAVLMAMGAFGASLLFGVALLVMG